MTPRNRRRPPEFHPRHVVLIGMMGVGKSTIGLQLAKRLGRRFVDLDHEIVSVVGLSIPDIFSSHGQDWFRAKETEVLSDCLQLEQPAILSAGGGTVLAEHNRSIIRSWSDALWLRASQATIVRRVGTGAGRPILADDPAGTIRRLLEERTPLYQEVADIVIDVDGLPVRSVVAQTVRALAAHQRNRQ